MNEDNKIVSGSSWHTLYSLSWVVLIIKYLKIKKKKNTLQISTFPLVLHAKPPIKQGSRTTGSFRSLTLSIYKNVFNLKV